MSKRIALTIMVEIDEDADVVAETNAHYGYVGS